MDNTKIQNKIKNIEMGAIKQNIEKHKNTK